MKLLKLVMGMVLMLILCMSTVTHADEEIVIDVVDNELQVQGYRVELSDVEKPITVDLRDNEIILYVSSTVGEVELNLGEGTIALTQRSVQFVRLTESAQGGPTPSRNPSKDTKCRYCGADNTNRIHYCPRCGLPYCRHNDIKCSYRLNPVPTPFSTIDPEGNKLSFYVSVDGTYIGGTPDTTKLPAIDSWAPGQEFGKTWATPSPSPTWPSGIPSPAPTATHQPTPAPTP